MQKITILSAQIYWKQTKASPVLSCWNREKENSLIVDELSVMRMASLKEHSHIFRGMLPVVSCVSFNNAEQKSCSTLTWLCGSGYRHICTTTKKYITFVGPCNTIPFFKKNEKIDWKQTFVGFLSPVQVLLPVMVAKIVEMQGYLSGSPG